MEKITVTILGTANAIPTKKRNHTGILISYKNENLLFDCGEGIQRQFRMADIPPTKLTRIFITHWHGDHILGLPGLLQTLAMSGYSKTLHIYGPSGTARSMSLIKELLLHIRVPTQVHEVPSGIIFKEKEFSIESASMNHGISTLAYSFSLNPQTRLDKNKIKKLKLPNSPLLGDLQKGKDITFNGKKIRAKDITYTREGKKITLILDTAYNESAVALAKDSDLLIAESTFAKDEEKKAKEYFHLTAAQAAQIAKKSKSKALILTHISQRYEHAPHIIEKEAKKTFKNTQIAKDLDVLEL